MFTGIIKGLFPVTQVNRLPDLIQMKVQLSPSLIEGLQIGASVAIDGVCLSVTQIEAQEVRFDVIQETLNRTTLNDLQIHRRVNVERSAKFSDEIGGHLVSGHVYGKAQISKIQISENHRQVTFQCPVEWMKYFSPKGFIGVDGASLTLVDVDPAGFFSVHLIPETLRSTTLGFKKESDWVNIELDSRTQTIVDTIERMMLSR